MFSAQVSRSMLGGSNKSADPSQTFAKLVPFVKDLITQTIVKGVDTVIGATKPSEATVTYFKAIGAGLTSMIWTPMDGTLSITGKTKTLSLNLGYERLSPSIPTDLTQQPSAPIINNQVSITMLIFPVITRNQYLNSDTYSNNTVILLDGTEDGQTKQIILGQGIDVQIVGNLGPTSLYLREPGNVANLIFDSVLKQWFLLNQAVYKEPLKSITS